MKKAIPVDGFGCIIGGAKKFTDEQWKTMVYNYGKKLRWKLVEEEPEEEKEIFGYGVPLPEDENLTKRELIKKYGLSEELIKSTKSEIIELIKNGEQYK